MTPSILPPLLLFSPANPETQRSPSHNRHCPFPFSQPRPPDIAQPTQQTHCRPSQTSSLPRPTVPQLFPRSNRPLSQPPITPPSSPMPSSSPRPELATNSCTDMIETHLLVVPWSYYRPPETEEEETKKICRERRRFEKGEGREADPKTMKED